MAKLDIPLLSVRKRYFRGYRIILGTLIGLFMTCLLALFYFQVGITLHSRIPLPSFGQTVPYAFKGATFFMTQSEVDRLDLLHTACWGLFGAIFAIMLLFGTPFSGMAGISTKVIKD